MADSGILIMIDCASGRPVEPPSILGHQLLHRLPSISGIPHVPANNPILERRPYPDQVLIRIAR